MSSFSTSGAAQCGVRLRDYSSRSCDAGPTCAPSAAEIDFALRNPNNEPLKTALAAVAAGQPGNDAELRLSRADGPLLIGVDDSVPGKMGIREITHPDGPCSLAAFSAAELFG